MRGNMTSQALTVMLTCGMAAGFILPGVAAADPPTASSTTSSELTAQTEAAALQLATETGEPVEVLAYRTERSDVHAQPEGHLVSNEHAQPVRTLQNGQWVPVDSDIVTRTDGSLGPRASVVELSLSRGGTEPLVRLEQTGRVMELFWPDALPAPTVSGSTATYPDVFADVDLMVQAEVDGFSHLLIVKTAEAAQDPALAAIELPIQVQGLDIEAGADGLIASDMGAGGVVFEAPAPIMWDSSTPAGDPQLRQLMADDPLYGADLSQNVSTVATSVTDGGITLEPDISMLTDAATTFPVYIDPVWRSTNPSGWTMVDSGYPNERYWKFPNTKHEGVGLCPAHTGTCNNSTVKRLFYQMPTPYQGKDILSAEFRVTLAWTYDSSSRAVSLYRMGSKISASSTWNTQPGGTSWASAVRQDTKSPSSHSNRRCTGTNQNVGFDVSEAVRYAANNNQSSVNFGVKADNESGFNHWKRFCENAVLVVHYNSPPSQPSINDMTMNPGGSCTEFQQSEAFVNRKPQLQATLNDPDHATEHVEQLEAQWRIRWTPPGETEQTWSSPAPENNSTPGKAAGSVFKFDIPSTVTIPEGVIASWDVRAYDGRSYSPWSTGTCRFVIDSTVPEPPIVTSQEYPDDDQWHSGIGDVGTFLFSSDDDDVEHYEYGLNSQPGTLVTPDTLGGDVTISFRPDFAGPNFITVRAIDRAGNSSATATHLFLVKDGRPAVGEWPLGDPAGSAQASDRSGLHPAEAGTTAQFGVPGPGVNTAVRLDGSSDSYLATSTRQLINTRDSFAAAVWVRPTALESDMAALSVNGAGNAGFVLGYSSQDDSWMFKIPDTDFDEYSSTVVIGGSAPVEGQWTHLAAVYDAMNQQMYLYVNGHLVGDEVRDFAWGAQDRVQMGRRIDGGVYSEFWHGDIAEATIHDRVLNEDEISDITDLVAHRKRYWQTNIAAGDITPEQRGGVWLNLCGSAEIYAPEPDDDPWDDVPAPGSAMVGTGHLLLDGIDDCGHAGIVQSLNTTHSYSVSARVRVASSSPESDMTVFSIPGANTSAMQVKLNATTNRWELVMAHDDTADPVVDTATNDALPPSTGPAGQLLTITYNAFTNQAMLYVNGVLASESVVEHRAEWVAQGEFQVGRARVDGQWDQYFSGAIDDIRLYDGVLDHHRVQQLANQSEQSDL